MPREWSAYLSEHPGGIDTLSAFNYFRSAPGLPWSLKDVTNDPNGAYIPVAHQGGYDFLSSNNLGCSVSKSPDENTSADGVDCTLDNKEYFPNRNLFDVGMNGSFASGFYYGDLKDVRSDGCGNTRYTTMKFKMGFKIPGTYWDADYGYDNLVNRTIRFDQTNKTIFGESSGFLAALDSLGQSNKEYAAYRNEIFYDGSQWQPNKTYGLLTPFEVHNFPFPNARILSGGVNTFLFPDEDPNHMYPSYFFSKFYGTNQVGNFRATILGLPADGTSCNGEVDSDDRCKTILQTTNGGTSSEVATQLLKHGTVNIMVSLDAKPEDFTANKPRISYPAKANWRSTLSVGKSSIQCPAYTSSEWLKFGDESITCGKFYDAGSRVHYYLNDFSETAWNTTMRLNDGSGILKNIMNSTIYPDANNLNAVSDLKAALIGNGNDPSLDTVSFRSNYYKNGKYYLPENLLGKPNVKISGLDPDPTITVIGVDSKDVAWNETSKRLEAPARAWTDPALSSNQIVYRRTLGDNTENAIPITTRNTKLTLEQMYLGQQNIQNKANAKLSLFTYNASAKQWTPNDWIRDVSLSNPLVTQLAWISHKPSIHNP